MYRFTFKAHLFRRQIAAFFAVSITAITITGCILRNGPLQVVARRDAPAIDFEITGVPPFYIGYGSSVPITENLSLTAAHVARLNYARVIAYHPICDIALIAADNRGEKFPSMGLVYKNQEVTTYGVNFNGDILVGRGYYRRDLKFVNYFYFYKCPASVMDAPIQNGMSGGGTFNSFGELVGIIVASADKSDTRLVSGEMLPYERISLFVSINYVRDWLVDTVEQYYGDEHPRLVWRGELQKKGNMTPIKKKRNYVLRH
ncbi:MAG: serine protease [Vibrionaceae bacterium]